MSLPLKASSGHGRGRKRSCKLFTRTNCSRGSSSMAVYRGFVKTSASRRLGKGCCPHNDRPLGIRLKALQKLIPGGRNMDADVLFQETAHYILLLRRQVQVLQTLTNFYSLQSGSANLGICIDRSSCK
eukprot:Gb_30108 [translate_table: standard]